MPIAATNVSVSVSILPALNAHASISRLSQTASFCEVYATFTNTVPLGAQRGSGRAEATFLCERLVDLYARRIGMDPARVRLQNMVPPEKFPYDNGLGWTYDSGNYAAALQLALDTLVDIEKVHAEQRNGLLWISLPLTS